jgi:AbrB family looped-hinge helix DNA binding protein
MRITSKGQVTIPLAIREKLGLLPHSEVEFDVQGDSVRIRKATQKGRKRSRGQLIVDHLRGRGNTRLRTDELMALLRSE